VLLLLLVVVVVVVVVVVMMVMMVMMMMIKLQLCSDKTCTKITTQGLIIRCLMELHREQEADARLDVVLNPTNGVIANHSCPCTSFVRVLSELVAVKAKFLTERGQCDEALRCLDMAKSLLPKGWRQKDDFQPYFGNPGGCL